MNGSTGDNIASGSQINSINGNNVTLNNNIETGGGSDAKTLKFGETIESLVTKVSTAGKKIYVSTSDNSGAQRASSDDGVTNIVATAVNTNDYKSLFKLQKHQKLPYQVMLNLIMQILTLVKMHLDLIVVTLPHTSILLADKLVKGAIK